MKMNPPIIYSGTATQSGTMEDGHRYYAVQRIRMEICAADAGGEVDCTITRTEAQKGVDGHCRPSPALPAYLNAYLSSYGACSERARGVWRGDLLCLRTEGLPVATRRSAVQWSAHSYFLVAGDDGRADGVAINREVLADRVDDLGRVRMRRVVAGPCGVGRCVD
jgi:hypothetical protein